MADQIFQITSGFYDAISRDRVYTAAQMNMPYKRLISNGVFATPAGTPSTDLQVSAGAARSVRVEAGNAMVGDRWVESPSAIPISVPLNTALTPRIDSVIVQVNVNSSSRAGSIIYRTGEPADVPAPPDLDDSEGVYEFRLANVTVEAGSTSLSDEDIEDTRGSEECPWVTSLIYQVDTSTLWAQYQAAYRQYFDSSTQIFDAYVATQRKAWEDFLEEAMLELQVTPSVTALTSVYTVQDPDTDTVPIGIASFNKDTDILQVYVNGSLARDWTISGNNVVLDAPLAAGNTVNFVCFKSLVTAELDSVVSLIRRLDQKVSGAISDSGWMRILLETPYTAVSGADCSARKIGSAVYVRGAVKGYDGVNLKIGSVPMSMAPAQDVLITTAGSSSGTSVGAVLRIEAGTGEVTVDAVADTVSGTDEISLDATYLADTGYGAEIVFSYKGSVLTYANLPSPSLTAIGDVYRVLEADAEHGVMAGDAVLWNGTSWEVLATTITADQIDDVLNEFF